MRAEKPRVGRSQLLASMHRKDTTASIPFRAHSSLESLSSFVRASTRPNTARAMSILTLSRAA